MKFQHWVTTVTVTAVSVITAVVFFAITTPSSAAPQLSNEMLLPIVGGVDGDTIKTRIDALPCPLCKVSIRLRGIDTPEKGHRAKCAKEANLALHASKMTKDMIGSATLMTVRNPDWDKYGGRIDGEVIINGLNVGNELIANGLARPYTGKGPKPDWCS